MFGISDQDVINNSITMYSYIVMHYYIVIMCTCAYRTAVLKVHFMKVIAIATQDYKVWVVLMCTGCENYVMDEVMMGHTMKDKFNDHKKV